MENHFDKTGPAAGVALDGSGVGAGHGAVCTLFGKIGGCYAPCDTGCPSTAHSKSRVDRSRLCLWRT